MPRRKVLHVIVGLDVGGAERTLQRLVDPASDFHEYEHVVVSLTTPGRLGPAMQSRGVRVLALGMRDFRHALSTLWKLRQAIRAEHPDIVQCWMYHADLMGGVAARLAGQSRIVWGIRTTDIVSGSSRMTAVVRRICAALSRVIPRIIVCAAEAARRTHVAEGYDSARMVVIPNGYDTTQPLAVDDQARQLRAQHAIGPDAVVIGCVARFNVYKDLRTFVRATGVVAASRDDVRVIMVGLGLERANQELMAWINETESPGRFILLGERDDVPSCLASMDIFCLSSRSEGMPNAVAEAMAMGVPCVATDVGDTAILVGDTGLIVPRENPAALASALSAMAGMPSAARRELGMRARQRIETDYSVGRMRERYDEVYDQVMRSAGSNGPQALTGTR